MASITFALLLGGCASEPIQSEPPQANNDEWEGWNRGAQDFNDSLDKAVLKPIAKGYKEYVPEPIDQGITNVFGNITDIGVTINDFLQLKMTQGGMDLGRFLVNTTVGLGGMFDVATMMDLTKHKEDFGQTLGFWGVPSGNYLVLPLIGPSSPRDAVGLLGDALMNPLTYISFGSSAAIGGAITGAKAIEVTDTRADLLSSEKIVDEASVDRYDFIKNAYQQNREYEVYDGNPPEQKDAELDIDDLIGPASTDATGNLSTATEPQPGTESQATPVPMQPQNPSSGLAPVIDNSRRLRLSAPER